MSSSRKAAAPAALILALLHAVPTCQATDPGRIAKGDRIHVAVSNTPLWRARRITERLDADTQLEVIEVREAWVAVSVILGGKEQRGWVHSVGVVKRDEPESLRLLEKINQGLAANGGRRFRIEADYLNQVMRIDASDSDMPPSALAHLRGLYSLEGLELGGTQVADDDLKHLAGLTNLRWLYLDNTEVSDAGLGHLKSLTAIGVVALNKTRVTGPGLAHFAEMKKLHVLNLSDCRVDDASLKHVAGLTRLRTLALQNTPLRGPGLKHLKKLRQLNVLNLNNTTIEGDFLLHLLRSQRLRILHMKDTKCSAASKDLLRRSIPALEIHDR